MNVFRLERFIFKLVFVDLSIQWVYIFFPSLVIFSILLELSTYRFLHFIDFCIPLPLVFASLSSSVSLLFGFALKPSLRPALFCVSSPLPLLNYQAMDAEGAMNDT